jgi:hypothetical protein
MLIQTKGSLQRKPSKANEMPFTAVSSFKGANQPGPGWIYRPPHEPPAVAVFFFRIRITPKPYHYEDA